MNLLDLPPELLCEILTYLDHRSYYRASLTCRLIHELCLDQYTRKSIKAGGKDYRNFHYTMMHGKKKEILKTIMALRGDTTIIDKDKCDKIVNYLKYHAEKPPYCHRIGDMLKQNVILSLKCVNCLIIRLGTAPRHGQYRGQHLFITEKLKFGLIKSHWVSDRGYRGHYEYTTSKCSRDFLLEILNKYRLIIVHLHTELWIPYKTLFRAMVKM